MHNSETKARGVMLYEMEVYYIKYPNTAVTGKILTQ